MCKKKQIIANTWLISKVLAKRVQSKISRHFLKLEGQLTKPKASCVCEMTTRILKTGTVLVNKLATGICDTISVSQTTKRFQNHYNKEVFFMKLFRRHISNVKSKICHGDYILFDGSDIQKKFVKRISKSQKYQLVYECGAIKVQNKIKGKIYDLWLVVTKRTNGGYCWFLTRSSKESLVGVIKEAFSANGFRCKIEGYHWHLK